MKPTGFKAYACYLFIKNIHFKNNNYNIMNYNSIPMKDKLLNNWNKKRRKQDGIKFQEIEKEFSSIYSLALLFSSYYVKNSNFYIQDIFDDNFEIFKNNYAELKLIKNVLTNDLDCVIMYLNERQIKPINIFVSNTEIPKIFKMGLSFNSIVILNDLFSIIKKNKDLRINSLEKGGWDNVQLNLKWYKSVIQKFLDDYSWKEIVKEILKK